MPCWHLIKNIKVLDGVRFHSMFKVMLICDARMFGIYYETT